MGRPAGKGLKYHHGRAFRGGENRGDLNKNDSKIILRRGIVRIFQTDFQFFRNCQIRNVLLMQYFAFASGKFGIETKLCILPL